MYAATEGPNVKWGAPISNRGPGTTAPPLATALNREVNFNNTAASRASQHNCPSQTNLPNSDLLSAIQRELLRDTAASSCDTRFFQQRHQSCDEGSQADTSPASFSQTCLLHAYRKIRSRLCKHEVIRCQKQIAHADLRGKIGVIARNHCRYFFQMLMTSTCVWRNNSVFPATQTLANRQFLGNRIWQTKPSFFVTFVMAMVQLCMANGMWNFNSAAKLDFEKMRWVLPSWMKCIFTSCSEIWF